MGKVLSTQASRNQRQTNEVVSTSENVTEIKIPTAQELTKAAKEGNLAMVKGGKPGYV